MLRRLLTAAALLPLATAAFAQAPANQAPPSQPRPAAAVAPAAAQPKAAPAAKAATAAPKPASTPEQRSAELLAVSSLPVFDRGTIERIQAAALEYEDIAIRGGWPTLPADAKFAAGDTGPNVDLLRLRLLVSGDLDDNASPTGPFDDKVVAALKRFQVRHGLAPSGTLTPKTLAALNVPVRKRIQQLVASRQRLSEMNFSFGPRYVVVNLPAAYAEAVENDKVVRRYRVIVGKTEKPSPTLTAEIVAVDLNPTWTVPVSITKNEIARHMNADPSYLSRMHMQVLGANDQPLDPASVNWNGEPRFTVRQEPGTWNALGFVRINMPNPYSVYMHDTNQRSLFSDDYRFDSHGCSRVDNVRDLAAWLMTGMPGYDRAGIDKVIEGGKHTEIPLPKKVPVAWIYADGWMDRDGIIHFREDVYHADSRLQEATAEEQAFLIQPVKTKID